MLPFAAKWTNITAILIQQVSIQGKMCQPGKECEMPPEFFYLAFDGVNYEENGKRKVY